MPEDIRENKRRNCEKECLRCQMEYQEKNPYDTTLIFLRNRCTTCSNGIRLKQLDSPENRGLVGHWQPW